MLNKDEYINIYLIHIIYNYGMYIKILDILEECLF
jgi:hypothetical protein